MFYRKKRITLISKCRFLIFMLFLVNLTVLNQGIADGVIKEVVISLGIDQDRRNNAFRPMYHWEFDNKNYTIKIEIDGKSYNKLRHHKKGRYRKQIKNLVSIVEEASETLGPLVNEFRRIMPSSWSDEKRINFVLAFVQCLPYTRDEVGTGLKEYYRYPIETLVDSAVEEKGVDCEDTSVLLASILRPLGYKVALLLVPRHIAVGVKGPLRATRFWKNQFNRSDYFFCETTGQGWRLGQVPEKFQGIPRTVMQISLHPSHPKKVVPQTTSKPKPPLPLSPQENLQKGIKLYEQTRFNEAIRAFRSALNGLGNPEQQALAHLYLGCSKRGFGETNDYVISEFQKALRLNPNQKLPPRIGEDHPVFGPMFEKALETSTARLTITASLPQAKIWIDGNLSKKRMLGAGTASVRLFEGHYTVEGNFESESKKTTVRIRPGVDEKLHLELPPIMKHNPPARVSIGDKLSLSVDIISHRPPEKIQIYYTTYDKNGSELKHNNKMEMSFKENRPAMSKWIYQITLPSQNRVGSIEYFIEAEYKNRLMVRLPKNGNRDYRISIVDDNPPTIALRNLPETVKVNQRITLQAEVTDNSSVGMVQVHFASGESHNLSRRGASSTYVVNIPRRKEPGTLRYYLTSTDEIGNKSRFPEKGRLNLECVEDYRHRKKFLAALKVIDDNSAEIRSGNSEHRRRINDVIQTSEKQVNFAEVTTDIYKFNQYKNKASELLSEAKKKVKTLEVHTRKDRKLINDFVDSASETEDSAKENLHLSHSFIETETNSLRYKIRGIRETLSDTLTEFQRRLENQENQLARVIRQFKPLHQGLWASYGWSNDLITDKSASSNWDGGNIIRLSYLREGRTYWTLGAQLDLPYDNPVNTSGIVRWGPPLGESPVSFAVLVGAAGYRTSDTSFSRTSESTQITPIIGGSLKLYPLDNVTFDLTGTFKLQSENNAAGRASGFLDDYLHHYEIGLRLYISPTANFKVGIGNWRIGEYDNTSVQIGLGATF